MQMVKKSQQSSSKHEDSKVEELLALSDDHIQTFGNLGCPLLI